MCTGLSGSDGCLSALDPATAVRPVLLAINYRSAGGGDASSLSRGPICHGEAGGPRVSPVKRLLPTQTSSVRGPPLRSRDSSCPCCRASPRFWGPHESPVEIHHSCSRGRGSALAIPCQSELGSPPTAPTRRPASCSRTRCPDCSCSQSGTCICLTHWPHPRTAPCDSRRLICRLLTVSRTIFHVFPKIVCKTAHRLQEGTWRLLH